MSTAANNTPTGPGWWCRDERNDINKVVYVIHVEDEGLWWLRYGIAGCMRVTDDGLWRGPVPMPGEWAPRELFYELWRELASTSPASNSVARDVLNDARAWDDANPKPGEPGHTRSFAFKIDQNENGEYVASDLPPMKPTGEWYSFTWNRETGEMGPVSPVDPPPTDEAP